MKTTHFLSAVLCLLASVSYAGDKIFGFGELGVTALEDVLSMAKEQKCTTSANLDQKSSTVVRYSSTEKSSIVAAPSKCLPTPNAIKAGLENSELMLLFNKDKKLFEIHASFNKFMFNNIGVEKILTAKYERKDKNVWEIRCNGENCPKGSKLKVSIYQPITDEKEVKFSYSLTQDLTSFF